MLYNNVLTSSTAHMRPVKYLKDIPEFYKEITAQNKKYFTVLGLTIYNFYFTDQEISKILADPRPKENGPDRVVWNYAKKLWALREAQRILTEKNPDWAETLAQPLSNEIMQDKKTRRIIEAKYHEASKLSGVRYKATFQINPQKPLPKHLDMECVSFADNKMGKDYRYCRAWWEYYKARFKIKNPPVNGRIFDGVNKFQCSKVSKITNQRCGNYAVKGFRLCRKHKNRNKLRIINGAGVFNQPTYRALLSNSLGDQLDKHLQSDPFNIRQELALLRTMLSRIISMWDNLIQKSPNKYELSGKELLITESMQSIIDQINKTVKTCHEIETNEAITPQQVGQLFMLVINILESFVPKEVLGLIAERLQKIPWPSKQEMVVAEPRQLTEEAELKRQERLKRNLLPEQAKLLEINNNINNTEVKIA